MYPHQKLEWSIARLDERLAAAPDDVQARLELSRALLSRALFHGGGEGVAAQALQHARKVLGDDPQNNEALVLAGAALVGMDRPEGGQKYLDEAVRVCPERPDLHLALGAMYRALGDRHLAIRHLENACRGAPDAWEAHLLLGRALAERARQVPGHRLVERSQYHLVQALKLEPTPDLLPPLMRDLGLSCLQTGRFAEAEKFFVRLRQHPRYAAVARKHLGQVAFALGKYKNAIQHHRQYLDQHADDAAVLCQVGLAYLHLGELDRAREHCNKALLCDPDHLPARHALGCVLVEEGQEQEALKVFRDTLADHPEDAASYVELARTRRRLGDLAWLQRALQVEVENHDRLPVTGSAPSPREITRGRIRVLLDELRAVGPSSVSTVLGCIDSTQEEGLRFELWDAACTICGGGVADEVGGLLREPGRNYAVSLARNALAAARWIPEPALTAGLNVTPEDVQRAAVDRRGNAHDLSAHRRAVEAEREVARAYQAVLLLAIASRRSRPARQLLATWGGQVDPEMQIPVLAAQVVCGEMEAAKLLHRRAQERGAGGLVERLAAAAGPGGTRAEPRAVAGGPDVHCSACGRTTPEATHLVAGSHAVLCDRCMTEVARQRRSLAAPDDALCQLCGRTWFEARGVYRWTGVDVCANCVEWATGLLERDEVDRFLSAW
jgi:tetratricopeptide (TPR) repeat protein